MDEYGNSDYDQDYGNESAYGGYDQEQQDALQAAIDAATNDATNDKNAADLNAVLNNNSGGGGAGNNDTADLDPYGVGGQYDISNAADASLTKVNPDGTTTYTMPGGSKFTFDPLTKKYINDIWNYFWCIDSNITYFEK